MCNLYDIGPGTARKGRSWRRLVIEAMQKLPKAYGIRKTDPGIVVRQSGAQTGAGDLIAEIRRWGFHRPFNPAINNARLEKLESGMWQSAWESGRRCLIPVSAFYEWSGSKGTKQTHAFQPIANKDAETDDEGEEEWFWMAGLWEDHPEHGPSYTMLTTASSGVIADIHNRMPAILRSDQIESFLELQKGASLSDWLASHPLDDSLREFRCLNPLKSSKPGPPVEDAFLF